VVELEVVPGFDKRNFPLVQVRSKLRSASIAMRRHRRLPVIVSLACAVAFVAVVVESASPVWVLGTAAALVVSSWAAGFAARAFSLVDYPSLLDLPRRQYGEVWDALAASPALAKRAACGHEDENALRRSAQVPVKNLIELVEVRPQDDILEFGCGVARIGLELAPRCRTWTGADLSSNMLATAAERSRELHNIRLVKLQQVGLDELESDSFDLVYSTNMLPHLDQMDRWRYVKDAFRVLRPRGRLLIDSVDLESEEGWGAFLHGADAAQESERPPYLPTPSTAAELTTYALRAGFGQVQAHRRSPLVIVTAVKAALETESRP
jgi:SAM-dependent methyltransferase